MPIRWSKCIQAAGDYFEGEGYPFDPEDLPEASDSEEEAGSSDSSDDV